MRILLITFVTLLAETNDDFMQLLAQLAFVENSNKLVMRKVL